MSTDQPPAGLYSPDGRYWWDGSAWQLAQQAPGAGPQAAPLWGAPAPQGNAPAPQWGTPAPQGNAPAPQWGAPAPQGLPPQGAPPRPGPRPVLIVGLIVVVALLVGVAAGWVVGSARTIAGAGPDAPPPIPEGFPGDSQRYLEGVTVSRVTQEWQDTGPSWTCDAFEPSPSGAAQATRCTVGPDLARAFTLIIQHDDDAQVREMQVTCEAGPQAQSCQQLSAWIAGSALAGEPERQQAAEAWATENFASDLSTTIGRVHLETRLEPQTIFVLPSP